jgi:catechol 2,3-dioxygenase-like lactoylglutathione lyase family enzyme
VAALAFSFELSAFSRIEALVSLSFHHLAIQVRDLAAAERFYAGLLGLQVLKRWPWPDGREGRSLWLSLGDGGGFLALEACDGAREPQQFRDARPGLHLLALRIEAAERAAWEDRLAKGGAPVVHRTAFTLYVADPEGNRVGLSHHPVEA